MEKIIMNYTELMEHWMDDSASWEFAEWFLDNAPGVPSSEEIASDFIYNLGMCHEDEFEETDEWVQSSIHATMIMMAEKLAGDKKYEVVPTFNKIEWNGQLSYNFSLQEVE